MPTTENILLVEDDPDQAMLFSQVLSLSGYKVSITTSAEEAQQRMDEPSFALLLVDWDLPDGMNGDALIRWTKALFPGIKTILISNHPLVDDIAAACGADAAFRKMESIASLRQLVMSLAPITKL